MAKETANGKGELMRLAGKVAWVTGAGRGIGAAIAHACAHEGAAVALAELDIEAAHRIAHEIKAAAPHAWVLAVHTDVTQPTSIQQAVCATEHAFGPLD